MGSDGTARPIDEYAVAAALKTLRSSHLFRYDCEEGRQSEASQLEAALAEYLGCRFVVAMNSCSSAILTALLCCGVKPGDRVLMPAFTFLAVPSAIVHARAQPVLVEMTEDLVVDIDDLKRVLETGVSHFLLSHMRGRVSDLDAITNLCEQHSVQLIEDCAHALGALWNGRPAGSRGRVAAYSAQSYKIIDGGEGGFLTTDDADIARMAVVYSGCYEDNWKHHAELAEDADMPAYVNALPAYNFRMSNLTAATILPQIAQIEERVQAFAAKYAAMADILASSDNIRLPRALPNSRPVLDSVQFEIRNVPHADLRSIASTLHSKGIKLSLFGSDPSNARCFWNWKFFERDQDCRFTRRMLEMTADMRLPLWWSLDDVGLIGKEIVCAIDAHAGAVR